MNYTTAASVRLRGWKSVDIAHLMYMDRVAGRCKEKSKSPRSRADAKRLIKELEEQFTARGQPALESHDMTIADLAKRCKAVKYFAAQYGAIVNRYLFRPAVCLSCSLWHVSLLSLKDYAKSPIFPIPSEAKHYRV